MHNIADFAEHMLGLLKIDVTGVTDVPPPTKSLSSIKKVGTSGEQKAVHASENLSRVVQVTCTNKDDFNQPLARAVTCGTPVTSVCAGGVTQGGDAVPPLKWHAIIAGLNRRDPPEWTASDRWREVVSDAGIFIAAWGEPADRLGWSDLDLFGVHPTAPGSRFDAMGLVLLIHAGAVVAMTDETATIRRLSGALLTYRRSVQTGAALLSEVRP